MTRFILCISMLALSVCCCAQKGVFAGGHKKWVNMEVEKHKEPNLFKGYTEAVYHLLQTDGDIEYQFKIYEKGTTSIVLLISHIQDALSYRIEDVVEIKQVYKKDNIQSATCKWHGDYNAKVFVLEKNIKGKPKNMKAWYTDTDKLKFTSIPVKGINCIVEGI